MSRLGNFRLPPMSAAVNVAKQLKRQLMPGMRDPNAMPPEGGPQEHVRFAQAPQTTGGTMEHCEMSNMSMNNQWSPTSEGKEAEDSFNQGYQTGGMAKQGSMSSVDFSEDDFQEGKSDVKINEYQAAWNVTNAIQVLFCVFLGVESYLYAFYSLKNIFLNFILGKKNQIFFT